jgi:hypothetical protein
VNGSTFTKLMALRVLWKYFGITALVPSAAKHLVALSFHALKHGNIDRFDKDMGDVIRLIKDAGYRPGHQRSKKWLSNLETAEIYERILKRLETNSGS